MQGSGVWPLAVAPAAVACCVVCSVRQPPSSSSSSSRRQAGGSVHQAIADGLATVQSTVKKSVNEPQQHGVMRDCMPEGFLEELFPKIKEVFQPHVVKYKNTNNYIRKEDAAQSGTGGTQEKVDWKVSSYMELHGSLGGQMQKQVQCDLRLLSLCLPMLQKCDELFSEWYCSKKGAGAIHELVRLQSFITRYRVNSDESAGLLRHIDGVQVDGSVILALPADADKDWRGTGGGVTVWEGPEEDEVQWDYAMEPGDICFLDNYVWHQGNPIKKGERWALVIFYRTKKVKGTRFSRMFLKAAAEKKRKAEVAEADRLVTAAAGLPAHAASK